MRARRLTLMLLFYVAADLSNPFMPGAFNFDADASVEVTSVRRYSPPRLTTMSLGGKTTTPELTPRHGLAHPEHRTVVLATAFDDWFIDLRRAHTPFHEPPSATDDH